MPNSNLLPVESDLFGFVPQSLEVCVTRYASGVLAPAIWAGFERAGRALCIPASEASPGAIHRASQYANEGGELFIDSGAFVYKDDPVSMPWERVISIYRTIAEAATKPVTFVLPDVVGSQEESLTALRAWYPTMKKVIGPGHKTLLPVQDGDRLPSVYVKEALLITGEPFSGLALPSNAKAFPLAKLADFANMPQSIPQRVHFLGISRRSKALQERILRLTAVWPQAEVSCDACEHRAEVGQGKPITENRRQQLVDWWDEHLDEWDDTECENHEVDDCLRAKFPGMDDEQIEKMRMSQIGDWALVDSEYTRHNKTRGPAATEESIYRFASESIS